MPSIKIQYQNETRRVLFKGNSFESLKQLCAQIFPAVRSEGNFKLSYIDDEGDIVQISTDLELQEAFRQSLNVLKIYVKTDDMSSEIEEGSISSEEETVVTEDLSEEEDEPAPKETFETEGEVTETQYEVTETREEVTEPEQEVTVSKEDIPVPKEEFSPVVPPVLQTQSLSAEAGLQKDMNLLEKIEIKIRAFMSSLSTAFDNVDIKAQLRQFLEFIKKSLKELSESISKNIVGPLKNVAKIRVADLRDIMRRMREEVAKLRAQLMEKISHKKKQEEVKKDPIDIRVQALADMGFTDLERNRELVKKHPNDLNAVLNILMM